MVQLVFARVQTQRRARSHSPKRDRFFLYLRDEHNVKPIRDANNNNNKDGNALSDGIALDKKDAETCKPMASAMSDQQGSTLKREEQTNESDLCCRICLQEIGPKERFFTPCGCVGTNRLVHFDCMKDWIKHQHTKTFLEETEMHAIACPVCTETIHLSLRPKNPRPTACCRMDNVRFYVTLLLPLLLLSLGVVSILTDVLEMGLALGWVDSNIRVDSRTLQFGIVVVCLLIAADLQARQ